MNRTNPICFWDRPFLFRKVAEGEKAILFLEVLTKIARVGLSLLALGFLVVFGLLNPTYLHISSTLVLVAYHPSLEVTVGTLERWVEDIKKEQEKYRAIIEGLDRGKSTLRAQIDALQELPIPPLDEKMRKCRENPSSETLRQELLELKKANALILAINLRIRVERAFVQYIERHQNDTRSLSDFGTFKEWPATCLLNDLPFTVFVTKTKEFTSTDNFSTIFTIR